MCFVSDTGYCFSLRQRLYLNKEMSVDALLEKAIAQLYDDRKIDTATRRQLAASHYEPLRQAVNEGYSQVQKRFEYGTPNYEFLKQLQTNAAVFAVFKNHACMKDMAGLLKDDSGNLRSREEFKREALKVDATYRSSKLDTEYDTGVRQARMAANWQKYVAKKKLYPNLRYLMSKAAQPDEKHLSYVGIVRPIDDPFWDTHYPVNRWRCQCSVEQTDAEPTDIPDKLPPVDTAFAFNAGKTGQVYDLKNSDYIKSVPPKEQPALIREAKTMVNRQMAADAATMQLYKSRNGGTVEAHPMALNNQDTDQVLAVARSLVNKNGGTIMLLPDVQDKALRAALLPNGVKDGKNPDYLINGNTVADLKTLATRTKKAIHSAVEGAYSQCNNLVLDVADSIPKYFLRRHLKGKLNVGYEKLETVTILYKGEIHKLTRQQILKGEWF